MSTRQTLWIWGPFHVFRDVVDGNVFLDIGRNGYNRAHQVWPPTLRRLY